MATKAKAIDVTTTITTATDSTVAHVKEEDT